MDDQSPEYKLWQYKEITRQSHPLLVEKYIETILNLNTEDLKKGFSYWDYVDEIKESLKNIVSDKNLIINDLNPILIMAIVENNDLECADLYEEIIKRFNETEKEESYTGLIREVVEKTPNTKRTQISQKSQELQIKIPEYKFFPGNTTWENSPDSQPDSKNSYTTDDDLFGNVQELSLESISDPEENAQELVTEATLTTELTKEKKVSTPENTPSLNTKERIEDHKEYQFIQARSQGMDIAREGEMEDIRNIASLMYSSMKKNS